MKEFTPENFQQEVLRWYSQNGRDFYWRSNELTPFELLLTELLLKRTRAQTVDNRGQDVLDQLESPKTVIQMDREELEDILQPFGLYERRSKNIQQVCQSLASEFDGEVPDNREELLSVSGIGQYTADAILCFSYGKPVLALDTNVIEVAAHYFGVDRPSDPRLDTEIRPTLEPLVPTESPEAFNWGLIDLGAKLRSEEYNCPSCPLDLPCFDYR